jgi:hypothetical protein
MKKILEKGHWMFFRIERKLIGASMYIFSFYHSFQDQVVSIVTQVFEANGSSALNPEKERVSHLLLVVLKTSLYMELCIPFMWHQASPWSF